MKPWGPQSIRWPVLDEFWKERFSKERPTPMCSTILNLRISKDSIIVKVKFFISIKVKLIKRCKKYYLKKLQHHLNHNILNYLFCYYKKLLNQNKIYFKNLYLNSPLYSTYRSFLFGVLYSICNEDNLSAK